MKSEIYPQRSASQKGRLLQRDKGKEYFRPLLKLAVFFILYAIAVPFFIGTCLAANSSANDVYSPLKNAYFQKWPALVPERQVLQFEPAGPAWKSLWDEARKLARAGKYEEAAERYETLIARDQILKQPRWEFARILFSMLQFDRAASLLEGLIEEEPGRVEYSMLLARIMHEKAHYSKAAELYGKVLVQDPENAAALTGLFFAHFASGQKDKALHYLEELLKQHPADRRIRRAVVELTYEMELFQKTRRYVAELAEAPEAGPDVLVIAAKTHDRLGLENLAVKYWQRIVALDPKNLESHTRLASYYEQEGRVNEALSHLLILQRHNPNDMKMLEKIGRIYLETGRYQQALSSFEQYLARKPKDRRILREMVRIYAVLGNKDKTLAYIEKYFAVKPEGEPVDVKEAARQYDATGHFSDAIPLYRHLLTITPDDPEVLVALAADILAIGDEGRSLSIWRHPERLVARGVEVYQAMAVLLESLGRQNDLLEALEVIHELDPGDDKTTMKLALLYLDRGEHEKSLGYFTELARAGKKTPLFLIKRGMLLEMLGRYEHALRDYEELLLSSAEWDSGILGETKLAIRLRCIRLAGELGLLSDLRKQISELEVDHGVTIDDSVRFSIAEALVSCGAYKEAEDRYSQISQGTGARGSEETRVRVYLAMAHLYEGAGLPYEAEQMLRMALSLNHDRHIVLKRLFDLSLQGEDTLDNAEIWLNAYYSELEGEEWQYWLMLARLMSRKGEHWAAIDIGRQILAGMVERGEGPPSSEKGLGMDEVHMALGMFYMAAYELRLAENHFLQLLKNQDQRVRISACVQLLRIYDRTENAAKLETLFNTISAESRWMRGLLLFADRYAAAGMYQEMLNVSRETMKRAPDSVNAVFYGAQALEQTGDFEGAAGLVMKVAREDPDNTRAASWLPSLLYRNGQFSEALERCEEMLASSSGRPDILILKARILWSQKLWSESLKTYEEYLEPSVDAILPEKFQAAGITVSPPPKRKTLLQLLKIPAMESPHFTERYFSASQAVRSASEDDNTTNAIIARLYGRFRWQQMFRDEMEARKSIYRREYIQALKQFESLLSQYPAEESLLFDLAGLYSSFDRVGDEAAVYEKMTSYNPRFPGLEKAMERNHIKRRPKISMSFGSFEEEGWDDYISIRNGWTNLSLWYSTATRQELNVSYAFNNYRSTHDSGKVRSSRADFIYQYKFLNGMTVSGGGGIEALGSGYSDTLLAQGEFRGKLSDKLESYVSFNRDLVIDTIASLKRNIVKHDLRAGVSLDITPRLAAGADYGFTDFSDDNLTKGYDFWTSYIIHSDPKLLMARYEYKFWDSHSGPQTGGALLDDGFAENDHPYWAPKNYWINLFSLYYKYEFTDDNLSRGIPRYLTFEYVVGYDAKGYGQQKLQAAAVVEITTNLIFEVGFDLVASQPYRKNDFSAGIVYRW